jgi:hypothetical protein
MANTTGLWIGCFPVDPVDPVASEASFGLPISLAINFTLDGTHEFDVANDLGARPTAPPRLSTL